MQASLSWKLWQKQTRVKLAGKYWVFTMSFLQLSGRAAEELIKRSKDPLLLGALGSFEDAYVIHWLTSPFTYILVVHHNFETADLCSVQFDCYIRNLTCDIAHYQVIFGSVVEH